MLILTSFNFNKNAMQCNFAIQTISVNKKNVVSLQALKKLNYMDFSILPYDRLPEFIRENENLRQILLQSGGIMKYVTEHIDDPTDENTPQLFVQYQNYVAENYRRANRYNPNRQNWSIEDLRQRALNGSNHLWGEYQSRRVLMRTLRMQTDIPVAASSVVNIINLKYLEYAWKEDLRRRHPDIETDFGTYRYVMQQFERCGWPMRSNGLACRSIDIVLKLHHGYELTETENFDCLNNEMFHAHFFGPRIIDRVQRGLIELLHNKNAKECRAEAIGMLKRVKWFSQHIYNDEVEDVYNDTFTLDDKRWLRGLLEHYDKDHFSEEELCFFYFGKLFADIGRIWEKQIRRYPDIDLGELEIETNTFINTEPSVRQITWEDEKLCFKNAVLHVMKKKKDCGDFLFEKPTQWKAVYRFAVDKTIMYDLDDQKFSNDSEPYGTFANFAHELQLDVNSSISIPFKKAYIEEMKKENYSRYNEPYPWSKDGINHARSFALYTELDDVYKALETEYWDLISQAEKAIG